MWSEQRGPFVGRDLRPIRQSFSDLLPRTLIPLVLELYRPVQVVERFLNFCDPRPERMFTRQTDRNIERLLDHPLRIAREQFDHTSKKHTRITGFDRVEVAGEALHRLRCALAILG